LAIYLNDIREHFHVFKKIAEPCYQMLTTKEQRIVEEEKNKIMTVIQPNARERCRVLTFCSITDKLSTEMERRSQVNKGVSIKFSFLNLRLHEEEYSRCCNYLVSFTRKISSQILLERLSSFRTASTPNIRGRKRILPMLSFMALLFRNRFAVSFQIEMLHCEFFLPSW